MLLFLCKARSLTSIRTLTTGQEEEAASRLANKASIMVASLTVRPESFRTHDFCAMHHSNRCTVSVRPSKRLFIITGYENITALLVQAQQEVLECRCFETFCPDFKNISNQMKLWLINKPSIKCNSHYVITLMNSCQLKLISHNCSWQK